MSAKPTTPMTGRLSRKETARRGDEIYQRDIRAQVEADHDGEVVAIDVVSGAWALGDSVLAARDRLEELQPDAIDVWLLRVGHRALTHFLSPRVIRPVETPRGER